MCVCERGREESVLVELVAKDRGERRGEKEEKTLARRAQSRAVLSLQDRQMALTEHRHQLGCEIMGALYF